MDNVSSNIFVSCTRDGISDSVEQSNHYELELPSNIKQAWQNHAPYVSLNPVARPISPKAGECSLSGENLPIKDQTNRTTTSSRIADKSLSYRIQSTSSNSIKCDRTCNHDFGDGVAEAQERLKRNAAAKRITLSFGLTISLIAVIALVGLVLAVVGFIRPRGNKMQNEEHNKTFLKTQTQLGESRKTKNDIKWKTDKRIKVSNKMADKTNLFGNKNDTNKDRHETQELEADSISPTCAHIRSNNANRSSGFYFISPQRKQEIQTEVYCNFDNNQTETVIFHNLPTETLAGNCELARCSKFDVVYDLKMPQIIALIEQSAACHQFIKYWCIGTRFLYNYHPTFAAWLSRDGRPQIYWGGATSQRDHYCACGETNSCVNKRYKCNCDNQQSTLQSDEGFLTDRNNLPVTGLQFGDLSGSNEVGIFTLGPLICSGLAD